MDSIVLYFKWVAKMSWWHFDYQDQFAFGEIIDKLDVYIWYNQPKSYKWLDEKYYRSCERKMKVPSWIRKSLLIYREILHEIDLDVSWDSTIKKWYFEKQKKKLNNLLAP